MLGNEVNNNHLSDYKHGGLESGNPNLKDTNDNIDISNEDYFVTDINAAEIDTTDELPSTQANTGTTYTYTFIIAYLHT